MIDYEMKGLSLFLPDTALSEIVHTMGNNTHITNVGGLVHETTDLILKQKQKREINYGPAYARCELLLTYCEVTKKDRGHRSVH